MITPVGVNKEDDRIEKASKEEEGYGKKAMIWKTAEDILTWSYP